MEQSIPKTIPLEAITGYLEVNPGAKRGELAEHIGQLTKRDPSTLWRYLQKLQEAGVIRSEGQLKGTRYYLNVPREAHPYIQQAVADIVRVGQTFALESLGDNRRYAYVAVQRALDRLTPDGLGQYGLRLREYDRYLERTHAKDAPLNPDVNAERVMSA
jgi:DNA-binding transcriptional ArsR family regulator